MGGALAPPRTPTTHNHTHAHHTPRARRAPRSVSVDAIGLSQCETIYVHTDTGTDTRLKSEPRRGECPTHTAMGPGPASATSSLPTQAPGPRVLLQHRAQPAEHY